MQISLLERFEVAERRGPSAREGRESDPAADPVVQGCDSAIAYHFVMPESARIVGRATVAGSHPDRVPSLSISVTNEAGSVRTILEQRIDDASEPLSIDRPLETSWREMQRIELSLACAAADPDLRLRWGELEIVGAQPAAPPEPEIARRRYNVLVILLDSLRADHVQPYGSTEVATPRLQSLADAGITFDAARSTAAWTRPAVASMLTSQYSLNHGIRSVESTLAPDVPYLPQLLRRAGYNTLLITKNANVSPAFGFDRGFARVVDLFRPEEGSSSPRAADPEAHANEIWSTYISPATANPRPFFIYLHERDPHSPYAPPAPFDRLYTRGSRTDVEASNAALIDLRTHPERADPELIAHFNGLYRGEITYMDRYVGTLFDRLEGTGLARSTLVVVVGDHGEEFWDHGSVGHQHTVYEELLRVPLILRLEGVLPEGLQTSVPVDLADVAPTILDVLGIPAPASAQGRSVLPYVISPGSGSGEPGTEREHFSVAQATSPESTSGSDTASVVYRDWKLIHTTHDARPPNRRLFDLRSDPRERSDVASAHPVVVGTLDQMRRWMRRDHDARQRTPGDTVDSDGLDEGTRENLRALGYVD